jgi:hypothetical protein
VASDSARRSWGQSHNSNILIRVSPEHPVVAWVGPHVFWFSVNWKNQVEAIRSGRVGFGV